LRGQITGQEIDRAGGCIGGDGSDLSQLWQVRYQRAGGAHYKAHARNENSVEEALQDRRETLVPNWINEDQPFRRHKPIA
jgi:hypothetical protein